MNHNIFVNPIQLGTIFFSHFNSSKCYFVFLFFFTVSFLLYIEPYPFHFRCVFSAISHNYTVLFKKKGYLKEQNKPMPRNAWVLHLHLFCFCAFNLVFRFKFLVKKTLAYSFNVWLVHNDESRKRDVKNSIELIGNENSEYCYKHSLMSVEFW